MKEVTLYNNKWGGFPVSEEGLKYFRIDYKCLAENVGDRILNLELINFDFDNWELYNGDYYIYYDNEGNIISEEEYYEGNYETDYDHSEIYQYYIISDRGAEFLAEYTDEIVYYNSNLDVYLWGITHWGTSWDYVLTNIKIKVKDETNE